MGLANAAASSSRGVYVSRYLVIALAAPCRDGAEELLARQSGTDLNRDADDEAAARGDELAQVIENADALGIDAVLEHFHARHDIVSTLVRRAVKIDRADEHQTGQGGEPPPAFSQLLDIDVSADGFGETAMRQGHERAVTAAVVEETPAGRG